MPINRDDILVGPASIIVGGQTLFSKAETAARMPLQTFPIPTQNLGQIDVRKSDAIHTVSTTLVGQWTTGILGVTHPYASTGIGAKIFPATDVPLVLHYEDGRKLTWAASAVTKMPDIILGAEATLMGDIEFTCLRAEGDDWAQADSMIAEASASYPGNSGLTPASVITQPYTVAWGASSPWDSFESMSPIRISFDLSVRPIKIDSVGTLTMVLENLVVKARMQPLGITKAQLLAALNIQGTGIARGQSLAGGDDLVISGTGVYVSLSGAAITSASYNAGNVTPHVGEIEWTATRTFSGGSPDPLFVVATAAPE